MFSMPPATTQWLSPALMDWAAIMMASSPEPQTLLTVLAESVSGSPALSPAWRAGFCPRPAWSTQPMMHSSMWSLAAGASLIAASIANAPI